MVSRGIAVSLSLTWLVSSGCAGSPTLSEQCIVSGVQAAIECGILEEEARMRAERGRK